jgi:hypothetical protein
MKITAKNKSTVIAWIASLLLSVLAFVFFYANEQSDCEACTPAPGGVSPELVCWAQLPTAPG